MKFNILALFIGILFVGCSSSADGENDPSKLINRNDVSDIIRMPVSANEPVDTTLVAKMEFEETTYEFGTVLEGKFVEHVFKFKNTGRVPLIISEAKATCGCTVPVYPKEAIEPGESSEISVKFNTAGKRKDQSKPVSLMANTFPAKTVLTMKGYVQPNPALEEAIRKSKQ